MLRRKISRLAATASEDGKGKRGFMRITPTRLLGLALAIWAGASACNAPDRELPGRGADLGKVVVYRDTWGVPHIYAPTAEQGAYAVGWAQAEDRPEELLKNFLRGMGEIASVEGPAGLRSDLMAHLWDNYGISRRRMGQLSGRSRRLVRAFVRGVNDYYQAHPADLPEWWGERRVDEAMVHAFGRLFLFSWSIDDGFGDLRRAGLAPDFHRALRGSNQWAVAPERSAEGAAILLVDPHLSWWGASRFWEFRIHAGDLVGSGFTLPGFPAIGLGHNQHLAWAMTTGGPDTADIYELSLKEDDPARYLYDGEWRDLTSREVEIEVAGLGRRRLTVQESHYGPVVASGNGRAYSLKTAYAQEVRSLDAWFQLGFGEDYRAAVRALETLQFFPQNIMVADTRGNIYYQRTGRVPVRPEGYDWSLPLDGSTSATEWIGLHPTLDLVQILNPPQGYMQNCNIPPDVMMVDSPLTPGRYPDYVYSDRGHGDPSRRSSNQRGARAVERLHANNSVSVEDAVAYALDIHPYGADRWVEVLALAHDRFGEEFATVPEYGATIEDVLSWDLALSRDSTAALRYFYWRRQLGEVGGEASENWARRIDDFLAPVRPVEWEPDFDFEELRSLTEAFAEAMRNLHRDFGRPDVSYGEVFRVGRGSRSWPVEGGGAYGTSTLRSISFGPPREDRTFWGQAGQTSTQVILLSSPIRSWTAAPIGQSDRPDSPHYTDQAERLFSPRLLKPTWWVPRELKDNIQSRTELVGASARD
jgi:acyl-homoserine-lactone acylase